jgi:hypothetical protein
LRQLIGAVQESVDADESCVARSSPDSVRTAAELLRAAIETCAELESKLGRASPDLRRQASLRVVDRDQSDSNGEPQS